MASLVGSDAAGIELDGRLDEAAWQRAAVATGRLAVRSGMYNIGMLLEMHGMRDEEVTLAEVLSGVRAATEGAYGPLVVAVDVPTGLNAADGAVDDAMAKARKTNQERRMGDLHPASRGDSSVSQRTWSR